MTSPALVNRYANALADVILSPRSELKPADAIAQLQAFDAIVQSSPELRTVLASPAVSAPRKRAVLRKLADAAGASKIVRNFLLVLSDHGRAGALHEVVKAFETALDERSGLVRVDIRSANPLTEAQENELTADLAKLAGRQVRTRFWLDPALIGGVTAQINSTVYDGSVRGRLAQMREHLAAAGR